MSYLWTANVKFCFIWHMCALWSNKKKEKKNNPDWNELTYWLPLLLLKFVWLSPSFIRGMISWDIFPFMSEHLSSRTSTDISFLQLLLFWKFPSNPWRDIFVLALQSFLQGSSCPNTWLFAHPPPMYLVFFCVQHKGHPIDMALLTSEGSCRP